MKTTIFTIILSALLILTGCTSKLNTHAYKLQNPDTDTALINSVLEGLWRGHSVISNSTITREGYAVVRTTSGGHSKIKRLLREVQKQDKTKGTKPKGKASDFQIKGTGTLTVSGQMTP
jgi:hypothetical protein